MEKKNFLNPQELFNNLSEMRRQAKENLIALMKENNLDYVHTDVDVCGDANCDGCYCHVYDYNVDCEYVAPVQGVSLTDDNKLMFDWFNEDSGTTDEIECSEIDVISIYSTVYSILVRKDGFDYKTWLKENEGLYEETKSRSVSIIYRELF